MLPTDFSKEEALLLYHLVSEKKQSLESLQHPSPKKKVKHDISCYGSILQKLEQGYPFLALVPRVASTEAQQP